MKIAVKVGVRLASRDQAFTVVWSVMAELFRSLDDEPIEFVLTSGVDGVHSDQSSHYRGEAWDFRGRNLSAVARKLIVDKAQDQLGEDFWVGESQHGAIHVQWKPVGPVNKHG